jgi:hypothetical protein
MMLGQQQGETRVQCAHCGAVYHGFSQTQVWAAAMACAGAHQVKSFAYAPELRPRPGVESGPQQRQEPAA